MRLLKRMSAAEGMVAQNRYRLIDLADQGFEV